MKSMSADEVEITEKVLRTLTERDPFEDGEVEISYSDPRDPGMLSAPGTCSARVLALEPGLQGLYEVTVSVRRIA